MTCDVRGPQAAPVQPPRSYVPVNNTKDNPPCNTLFIGNLSESTNEDELRGLFAGQPGFRQLKVVRGARSVTCFVEFSDVATAMAVHQSQQVQFLGFSLVHIKELPPSQQVQEGTCSSVI